MPTSTKSTLLSASHKDTSESVSEFQRLEGELASALVRCLDVMDRGQQQRAERYSAHQLAERENRFNRAVEFLGAGSAEVPELERRIGGLLALVFGLGFGILAIEPNRPLTCVFSCFILNRFFYKLF